MVSMNHRFISFRQISCLSGFQMLCVFYLPLVLRFNGQPPISPVRTAHFAGVFRKFPCIRMRPKLSLPAVWRWSPIQWSCGCKLQSLNRMTRTRAECWGRAWSIFLTLSGFGRLWWSCLMRRMPGFCFTGQWSAAHCMLSCGSLPNTLATTQELRECKLPTRYPWGWCPFQFGTRCH